MKTRKTLSHTYLNVLKLILVHLRKSVSWFLYLVSRSCILRLCLISSTLHIQITEVLCLSLLCVDFLKMCLIQPNFFRLICNNIGSHLKFFICYSFKSSNVEDATRSVISCKVVFVIILVSAKQQN